MNPMDKPTYKKALQLLERIEEWANDYPSWLAASTDFSRGYKDGICTAKRIVRDILNEEA